MCNSAHIVSQRSGPSCADRFCVDAAILVPRQFYAPMVLSSAATARIIMSLGYDVTRHGATLRPDKNHIAIACSRAAVPCRDSGYGETKVSQA